MVKMRSKCGFFQKCSGFFGLSKKGHSAVFFSRDPRTVNSGRARAKVVVRKS